MVDPATRPHLEGHISRAFDGALAAFHLRVVAMGGLVLAQVQEAVRAYTDRDREVAQRVHDRERDVNAYDVSADGELLALLARRAPMANDLRAIVALSKAVAELERAGDEAKKIARTVLADAPSPSPATVREARYLGRLAVRLLRQAVECLDRLDTTAVAAILTGDRELDAEYAAGLRRLLSRAMEDPHQVGVTVEAAFVLKSLERIGDHARNLARHIRSIG
jgi:phosphate transport system protein